MLSGKCTPVKVVSKVGENEDSIDVNSPAVTSSEQHPLMNPNIVGTVAKYLPLQDLIPSKMVCNLWNEEMTRRQNQIETLDLNKENMKKAEKMLLRKKVDEHFALSAIQLVRIEFHDKFTYQLISKFGYFLHELLIVSCKINLEVLKSLLTHQCPNLGKLSLNYNRYVQEADIAETNFPGAVPSEMHLLPRLQRLELNSSSDTPGSDACIPILLEDIVRMCPKLKKLNCHVFPPSENPDFLLGYQWDSLHELTISYCIHEIITIFVQNSIIMKNLNYLNLDNICDSSSEDLKLFVNSVAENLDMLTLFGLCVSSDINIFPIDLPNLGYISISTHFLSSFDFLEGIPNLQWFELHGYDADPKFWKRVLNKSKTENKYLNVNYVALPRLDEKAFEKLVMIFPNLEVLAMEPDIRRETYYLWPLINFHNLVEIWIEAIRVHGKYVEGTVLTDTERIDYYRIVRHARDHHFTSGKLGTSSYFQEIKDVKGFWYRGQDDIKSETEFTNFQELTSFFIVDCQITDLSLKIIEDFMPKLKVLKLVGCKDVTKEGIKKLQLSRKDLKIIVLSDLDLEDWNTEILWS